MVSDMYDVCHSGCFFIWVRLLESTKAQHYAWNPIEIAQNN